VQGVGFRPFVYRIALQSNVKGYVKNLGGSEVEVRVEGDNESVAKFFYLLFTKLPRPAKIEKIEVEEVEPSASRPSRSLRAVLPLGSPAKYPRTLGSATIAYARC